MKMKKKFMTMGILWAFLAAGPPLKAEEKEFKFFGGIPESKTPSTEIRVEEQKIQVLPQKITPEETPPTPLKEAPPKADTPEKLPEAPRPEELLPESENMPKYEYQKPRVETQVPMQKEGREGATKAVAEAFMNSNERKAMLDKELEILQLKQKIIDTKYDIWKKTKEMDTRNIPQGMDPIHTDTKNLVESIGPDVSGQNSVKKDPTDGIVIQSIVVSGTRSTVTLKVGQEDVNAEVGDYVTDLLFVKIITNKVVYLQNEQGQEFKLYFRKKN